MRPSSPSSFSSSAPSAPWARGVPMRAGSVRVCSPGDPARLPGMAPRHGEGKKKKKISVAVVIIVFGLEFSAAGARLAAKERRLRSEALRLLLGPGREGNEGPSPAWLRPRCGSSWEHPAARPGTKISFPHGLGGNQPPGSLPVCPRELLGSCPGWSAGQSLNKTQLPRFVVCLCLSGLGAG